MGEIYARNEPAVDLYILNCNHYYDYTNGNYSFIKVISV